jgi:hypothetical protein
MCLISVCVVKLTAKCVRNRVCLGKDGVFLNFQVKRGGGF